jgi:hypothetical protein
VDKKKCYWTNTNVWLIITVLANIWYINLFVFKNLKSNNQYFFSQTMISRFNLLPHRHFHYLSLIESLFDSCFGNISICAWYTLWPTRTKLCGADCFTPTTNEQHQCLMAACPSS